MVVTFAVSINSPPMHAKATSRRLQEELQYILDGELYHRVLHRVLT